jgi:hypothetical protein
MMRLDSRFYQGGFGITTQLVHVTGRCLAGMSLGVGVPARQLYVAIHLHGLERLVPSPHEDDINI